MAGQAGAPGRLSLGDYLVSATSANVYALNFETKERYHRMAFTPQRTRDYLARIELSQIADGPVVRCPSDLVVEFHDAAGRLLGTLGFCQEHARFDASDGTFGGVRAARPY